MSFRILEGRELQGKDEKSYTTRMTKYADRFL
jgi:hypothetical protein